MMKYGNQQSFSPVCLFGLAEVHDLLVDEHNWDDSVNINRLLFRTGLFPSLIRVYPLVVTVSGTVGVCL
jgi:hypothetical protein